MADRATLLQRIATMDIGLAKNEQVQSLWLVLIWGDIEQQDPFGPLAISEASDQKAKELKREYGDEHGIFKLDVSDGGPSMDAYSGAFFKENRAS